MQFELLNDRIANTFDILGVEYEAKKMFGGLFFMVDDKMCIGTFKGGVMARVGPEQQEILTNNDGIEQILNGKRIMKGFVSIQPHLCDNDDQLEYYIQKCLDFNPFAKSSKKNKKSKK